MKAPKTFEEGMTRLEDILAKMQSDDTSLAESVKLYAEAASLVEYCSRTLGKVSLQIEEIDSRLQLHDFRMVRGKEHTNFIFDLVIPRELKGKEKELQRRLDDAVQQADMKYYTVITFDDQSFSFYLLALFPIFELFIDLPLK